MSVNWANLDEDAKKRAHEKKSAQVPFPSCTFIGMVDNTAEEISQKGRKMLVVYWKVLRVTELEDDVPEGFEDEESYKSSLIGKKRKHRFFTDVDISRSNLALFMKMAGISLAGLRDQYDFKRQFDLLVGTEATVACKSQDDPQYKNYYVNEVSRPSPKSDAEPLVLDEIAAKEEAPAKEPAKKTATKTAKKATPSSDDDIMDMFE